MTCLILSPETQESPDNYCPVGALASPPPLGACYKLGLHSVVGRGQETNLGDGMMQRTS